MRRTIFTIPKELQKDSSIELFYHCQQTSTPENGEELALEFRVNLATKDNKPADIFPFNSLGRLNFEEIKCAYCHKVGPWKKDRTEVYIGSTKGWAYEHKAPEKT